MPASPFSKALGSIVLTALGMRELPTQDVTQVVVDTVRDRPKIVRYWLMTVTGGEWTPNDEVDELRWLPPADHYPARLHQAMRYSTDGGKRWTALMRFQVGLVKAVRIFVALQAVGGLAGMFIGVVTLDSTLAAGGLAWLPLVIAYWPKSYYADQSQVESGVPAVAWGLRYAAESWTSSWRAGTTTSLRLMHERVPPNAARRLLSGENLGLMVWP